MAEASRYVGDIVLGTMGDGTRTDARIHFEENSGGTMIEAVITGIFAGVTYALLQELIKWWGDRKNLRLCRNAFLENSKNAPKIDSSEALKTFYNFNTHVRVADNHSMYCTVLCPRQSHYHEVGDGTEGPTVSMETETLVSGNGSILCDTACPDNPHYHTIENRS